MGDQSWTEVTIPASDSGNPNTAYQRLDVPYQQHGNALQTLDICIPATKFKNGRPAADVDDVWIVYIHGGAWRDPLVSSKSFEPAQNLLLTEKKHVSVLKDVAGFATLNYTLSPYPTHPSNPSGPNDPSRNAKHPTHIHDVLTAIHFLQTQFGFGARYVLAGHSCGATLAFQSVMKSFAVDAQSPIPNITSPQAIVGFAGLYDLADLVKPSGEEHDKYLALYKDLVVNSFGSSEDAWNAASPTSNLYSKSWPSRAAVFVAHSSEDTLVPMRQYELMLNCLQELGNQLHALGTLTGDHNDMWRKGRQIAEVIAAAIKTMT